MDQERFPLSWPQGWPRATRHQRAAFRSRGHEVTVAVALQRLQGELDRLGAVHALVSSNIELRLDGLPRSGQAEPRDPGVACYFTLKKKPIVLACDKWHRVADNIAAIAQHIDALRRIDRYGVGRLEQAFAGYAALPAQASPWWTVLEFETRPAAWDLVTERHSDLAKRHHPDRGGNSTRWRRSTRPAMPHGSTWA